jgi:hypothetical protein
MMWKMTRQKLERTFCCSFSRSHLEWLVCLLMRSAFFKIFFNFSMILLSCILHTCRQLTTNLQNEILFLGIAAASTVGRGRFCAARIAVGVGRLFGFLYHGRKVTGAGVWRRQEAFRVLLLQVTVPAGRTAKSTGRHERGECGFHRKLGG